MYNQMHYQFTYRAYAEALYEALQVDAFYTTLEHSVDNGSSREAMLRYLDYSIKEAERYGAVVIPGDHNYGISIWSKPLEAQFEAEKYRQKQQFLEEHMGNASLDTYNAIVDFMSSASGKVVDDNYWYLSIVGILPEHQGKGLGAELLEQVLKETDQLQIPTYLETFTPRNVTFYNRFGYHTIESIDEPSTGSTYQVMVRDMVRNRVTM